MLRKLAPIIDEFPDQLIVRQVDPIHAKGIVSDHFAFTGSMNITYNGVHINDENIDYTVEPAFVHERLAQFEAYLGNGSS